jgi:hypothetical protein
VQAENIRTDRPSDTEAKEAARFFVDHRAEGTAELVALQKI